MMRGPGEQLRRWWATEGPVRGGVSEVALTAFERDLGITLPPDFRDYLAVVDGMHSGQWVGPMIDFWPIERIREESDQWGCFEPGVEGSLLPFADFLLNSHAYAIRLSSTASPIFVVFGHEPLACASSFEEFVTRYQQDHPALYGGP